LPWKAIKCEEIGNVNNNKSGCDYGGDNVKLVLLLRATVYAHNAGQYKPLKKVSISYYVQVVQQVSK